jgi:protein-L-isoaspartate(D-aspartate) O-methyltransferase
MEDKKMKELRHNLLELWKREEIIKSELLINAILQVPREDFIPEKIVHMTYEDEDIKLDDSSVMLQIKTIIKIIEEGSLEKNNKILIIGSSTGYEEALLTVMGMKVDVLEPRIENIQRASSNLGKVYPNHDAPQYHRRFKDISKVYDRILCFGTISTIDKQLMELVDEGIMVLSVGEKHLLMRLVMKGDNNPIMQFHGILWMPLIDDAIF